MCRPQVIERTYLACDTVLWVSTNFVKIYRGQKKKDQWFGIDIGMARKNSTSKQFGLKLFTIECHIVLWTTIHCENYTIEIKRALPEELLELTICAQTVCFKASVFCLR